MNPMLVVTLLAIGLAIFFGCQSLSSKKRSRAEDKVMKGYFLLGLSGLMAKIAIADGRVSADEAGMANRFFNDMDLSDAEKAICIGNFVKSRRDGLEVRDHAKRFMAYANSASCEFLYELLWKISMADGKLDDAEDRLLKELAADLGVGNGLYEDFKAGKKRSYDKAMLREAGVPPSLVALAD